MENENVPMIPEGSVLVTPKGAEVIADGVTGMVEYPSFDKWVLMDLEQACGQGANAITSRDYPERLAAFHKGEKVNLTRKGQLALRAVMGMEFDGQPIIGKLNANNNGAWLNYMVPTYDIFEHRRGNILEFALSNFSQKFILRNAASFAFWDMGQIPTFKEVATEYGESKELYEVNTYCVELATSFLHGSVNVNDGMGDYPVIHQFNEGPFHDVIFTARTKKKTGWWVADAEKNSDGQWCDNTVVTDIEAEMHSLSPATEIFLSACKFGLRRIKNPF